MTDQEDTEHVAEIIGSPNEEEALPQAKQEQETPDFELGDTVMIVGGRFDGTRGRIYYIDDTRLHILPDGVSDRLVEIPIVDGDLDPALQVEHFYHLAKRASPAFVVQINAQVGYTVEAFTINGDSVETNYTIKSIDETTDSMKLEDSTGGILDLECNFRGIPLDAPFAVLRPRQPVGALSNLSEEDDVTAAAEQAAEEEAEFTLLEELTIPEEDSSDVIGLQELPASMQYASDAIQRNTMFQEILASIPIPSQKNQNEQRLIRRLVEQLLILRNELVEYTVEGEPLKQRTTSFQTIGDLLAAVDIPLARPVVEAERFYFTTPTEGLDGGIEAAPGTRLQPFDELIQNANTYAETQLGGVSGMPLIEGALPNWILTMQRYLEDYGRSWIATGSDGIRTTFQKEKEFLSPPLPDSLQVDSDGRIEGPLIVQRALGPRLTRLQSKDGLRRVEAGDEGGVLSQILFPLSTEDHLGSTRSGKLSTDIAHSHQNAMSMKDIVTALGGVTDSPTAGGILSIGPGGNTNGSITLEDWLSSQPLFGFGLGDLRTSLQSLGFSQQEFTVPQQELLVEKVDQLRALLKQSITEQRTEAKAALGALKLEEDPFLQGEALEAFFANISAEPLLQTALTTLQGKFPAYRNVDVAAFAGLNATLSDLLLKTLAAVPGPLARERARAVRAQFLEALRNAMLAATKREFAGEEPQPNRCPHVGDLAQIRKVRELPDRMQLLARYIARFKKEKKDNWYDCSVCNEHLLCYHEGLLLQEFLRPKEKDVLHKELLLHFSGGVFQGKYMCKNCGQPISDLEFDTNMEYDDEGRPMVGRAVLEDIEGAVEEGIENALLGDAAAAKDKAAPTFDSERQSFIYKAAQQIFNRIGIFADTASYKGIVERVETELDRQPSQADYARIVKARGPKAGAAAMPYENLINRVMVSSVGAHILLEIQTRVPGYMMRYRMPGCKAGFSGFPMGPETDTTGIEYISCAIAGLKVNEAPWNLTGFLRETSDKKRIDMIGNSIKALLKEALKTGTVQQMMNGKREYLEKTYGAAAAAAAIAARLPEQVLPSFRPVPYTLTAEEAAAAVVVSNAASPSEAVRAWIQAGHRMAREFGTYMKGTPFSEASCCFAPITRPREFWSGKEKDLPVLPKKTPPRGPDGSTLFVHYVPRKQARLLAEPPEDIFYRIFLKVCYDGPRKGLPHEPGYTNTCPHCSFVFPESPYIETPLPPQSSDPKLAKELYGEWLSETEAIIMQGKTALETQKVEVNKKTFEDLLDTTHKRFNVAKLIAPKVPTGSFLLGKLLQMEPTPFPEWRDLMTKTLGSLAALKSNAGDLDIATAYGPMSDFIQQTFSELQAQKGSARFLKRFQQLLEKDSLQAAEAVRTYFLVPFQRLLADFKLTTLNVVVDRKVISQETEADMQKVLQLHLGYLQDLRKRVNQSTKEPLQKVVGSLSKILPILRNELRAAYLPGGQSTLKFITAALFAGIFQEFLHPTSDSMGDVQLGGVAQDLFQIFDICLQRYSLEGLDYTEDTIRDMLAKRKEVEKQSVISKFGRMTEEEKTVELVNKRLGLGDWAVGGTKAIRFYDPAQYEVERQQRAEMGLTDFSGEYIPEGEAGDEGGYDNSQMAEDDY